MAFGRKKTAPDEARTPADYYKLHTEAINDLVNASPENSPEVSEAELRKYRSRQGIRLSDAAKALLLKGWFNGACCFFFFWGIGFYVTANAVELIREEHRQYLLCHTLPSLLKKAKLLNISKEEIMSIYQNIENQ